MKDHGTEISRWEWLILLGLVLVGFGLRAWQLDTAGLDHFDEGVYVFSAWGLTDADLSYRLFPEQEKFSPPLYFSLVGLSYLLAGGPSDMAAIWVNVILGTLTIPLLWWVGRRWFGEVTAVFAATLLTLSEYHIELSRTALTDVAFALIFLLALAVIDQAFRRQQFRWAVVAGLVVGLAWNTKYHGWFALIAAAGALVPFLWFRWRRGESFWRYLWLWGVMTAVAAAVYLPWALYIQSQPGGYAGLTAYQRTLINRDVFQNIWQHIQFQSYFLGPLSRFSVPAALLLALLVFRRNAANRQLWLLLAGVTVAGMLLGNVGTAVLLAIPLVILVWRQPQAYPGWLLLAWLGLWLASTPLYKPYARLILPFVLAAYLAAGYVLQTAVRQIAEPAETPNRRPVAIMAGVTAVLLALAFFLPSNINPWQPERSQAETATAVREYVPPGSRVIVIGEPTLAFYLSLDGYDAFERIEDMGALSRLTEPVYLMTGVYVDRAPSLRNGLEQMGDRLTHLATFEMNPGDVRLLDDARPHIAKQFRENPDQTYDLELYYLEPAAP